MVVFILAASSYSSAEIANRFPALSDTWITDKLGHIQVSALHIDSLENLWVGTQSSLFLFSGNHIETHDLFDPKIREVLGLGVTAISEDDSGNVYVGTHGLGLVKFKLGLGTVSHVSNIGGHDVSYPERVFAFSNELVWLVTPQKLLIVKSFSTGNIDTKLSGQIQATIGSVHSVDRLEDGIYSVGGEQGIVFVDLHLGEITHHFELVDPKSEWRNITASLALDRKLLIFGSDTGHIGSFNTITQSTESLAKLNQSDSARILSIEQFGDGIALSTDHGAFISDRSISHLTAIKSSNAKRTHYSVSNMLVDDDMIWVGTLSGVKVLLGPVFDRFEASGSLKSDDVLAIEEDNGGRVWIGTFNGLYMFDSVSESHKRVDTAETWPEEYSRRISVLTAAENFIWLGFISGRGVLQLNTDTLEFREVLRFQDEDLSVLDIKIVDNVAWIGTHERGLIRHTKSKSINLLDQAILPASSVNEILETSWDELALATIRNILLLNPTTLTYREIELDLSPNELAPEILEIFEDIDGNLWIGTAGKGLYFVTAKSLSKTSPIAHKYFFHSSLDHASVTNICSTDEGEFWLSAGGNVARFTPFSGAVYVYNSSDGLPSAVMATDSSLCSSSGALYFGSTQGYSRLSHIPPRPPKNSKVRVVEVLTAGKKLSPIFPITQVEKLVIGLEDLPLSLKFAVTDYRYPDSAHYRYKLGDDNQDWIHNGNSEHLTIPSLSTGKHRLTVQATNSKGMWINEEAVLDITVNPPFWQTPWSYILYLSTGALIVWSIQRIHQSYVAERRSRELIQEIEETRNKAEDEIQEQLEFHDELARAAHKHHGGILELLRHCLDEAESKETFSDSRKHRSLLSTYIEPLSLLENCTIYDEGDVSVNLNEFVDKLFEAISSEFDIDHEKMITVNEVKSDPLTLQIGTTLAIMIYELAINALLHAYADESPANYLRVISRTSYCKDNDEETFSVIVRDNGKGSSENAIESPIPGSGIGLVASLARSIGSELSYSYDKGTIAKITLTETADKPIFA